MAFNPFHSFRKYRKQSFAILTIICMLTFVLSSGIGGGGDFFDQVSGLFGGGKRARGGGSDEVARLDGRKITAVDLQHLRRQRELANDFMANAVALSLQTVAENLERDVAKLGDSF